MTIPRPPSSRSRRDLEEYYKILRVELQKERQRLYEGFKELLGEETSDSDLKILAGLVRKIPIPDKCWMKK